MTETQIAAAAIVIMAGVAALAAFGFGLLGKIVGASIHTRWIEPRLRRQLIEREDDWRRERQVSAARNGDWIDPASLAIVDFAFDSTALRVRAISVVADRAVGFGLSVVRRDDPVAIVELTRTGPESDAFIRLLADMAGERADGVRFREAARGVLVLLEVGPSGSAFEDLRLLNCKLFFEPDPLVEGAPHAPEDEETAELYVRVDLTARILTISEKDPGYRSTLIRRLGEPGNVSA